MYKFKVGDHVRVKDTVTGNPGQDAVVIDTHGSSGYVLRFDEDPEREFFYGESAIEAWSDLDDLRRVVVRLRKQGYDIGPIKVTRTVTDTI